MPQVLDWCAAAGAADAWAARRWRSEPEWRAAVSQRRAAAHPLPTFLQRLLRRLGLVRLKALFDYIDCIVCVVELVTLRINSLPLNLQQIRMRCVQHA